jgi:hypothetical protein
VDLSPQLSAQMPHQSPETWLSVADARAVRVDISTPHAGCTQISCLCYAHLQKGSVVGVKEEVRGRGVVGGAVKTMGQSKRAKRGGGDRSSRPAQFQARQNEQAPTLPRRYVRSLNQGIYLVVVRRIGSAHSVPTSSSYYITQRNFDMRKSLNFPHHIPRRDLGKLSASVPKSGASAVPPLSRERNYIENSSFFELSKDRGG